MKHFLILLIFCLVSYTDLVKAQNSSNPVLTTAAMQQDFNYLRKTLEETHPGLYAHQSKEVMQRKMDSLYMLLDKPMTFYQFYSIIANLITEVRCDHTSCYPYRYDVFQAKIQEYKLIPFVIYFSNHKAYVVINQTKDTGINLGDEILTINNHPIDSIEKALFKYIPGNGNIETNKERLLSTNMAFNVWYYLFIERPDAFDIVFRSLDGQLKERHFANELTLKESNKNTLSNPANKQILATIKRNEKNAQNPCSLKFVKDKKTAILTVSGFPKKNKMQEIFARTFSNLKKKNTPNLIINLADNAGGDEASAAELLSYLISKPTKFITDEYLITANDDYLKLSDLPAEVLSNKDKFLQPEKDGKFFVKEETQGELPIVQPKADRFSGKVYFYINGGTASAASTFASVTQSNHLGTFIGEETGGAYSNGGSSAGLNLTLPNTGITAHTSIVYSMFATQGDHDKNRGVMPDYYFVPTFKELISGNTSWQNYIFKLIEAGK